MRKTLMAVVKAYTPYGKICAEDLFAPDMPERFIELIEGELAFMSPAGFKHENIGGEIEFQFRLFARKHAHVAVGTSNMGFLIQRNPDTLLCPDACLFRKRPWPDDQPWGAFAPELWVEVLSPSNSEAEMTFKRHRLFDAGTEQFWLVLPKTRELHIHHRDGRLDSHPFDATITGEGIVEGLSLSLADIFCDA
jgi:Uma2 family endonuclease